MKRILVFLSMLFCLTAIADDKVKCHQGEQDKKDNNNHDQETLDDTSTSGGISADPNEIIGPMGYDSIHWVSVKDVLNYTILFENDPEFATANAQKVDVRFTFEDKAQMKGFGLGTYGFANRSWDIEKNPAAYQNRLDLRDSMHIYVDLTAGIDVVKQQAFWLFNSIDPETGYNPWQVDRGMLPVNDSTHVGEGFVKFQLIPNETLQTGDTISIAANIVFDQNDTIPTNRWCVTIDAGAPTSKVKGKKDSKNENLYHLTVQAADDENGSGLKRVMLYQANNFGIYEEYAVCPLDTVIDFKAEPGRQYRFYTLAEDNVGNLEALKEEADLVINVNAAPTDIALSDSIFQDDIAQGGFIAELTSEDIETESTFTYALAEGEGAIHNEMFQISGTQLQAKECFKCAEDSVFKIRLSTTDEGGLSFSKAFELHLKNVLIRPDVDTLNVNICEGDVYNFFGKDCEKAGIYRYEKSNEFMCDSVFVLNLSVLPRYERPTVTVEGTHTLVSSSEKGNQWFREDGTMVANATGQKFTPEEDGIYYVCASNGSCLSEPSKAYRVQLSDYIDLSMNLANGWNWVSSNLSDQGYRKATDFIKPISDHVERLVGFNAELVRDPNLGLVGNLNNILPSESYLLQTNQMVENTWSGTAYNPENTVIDLQKGWNWIGYVPVSENSLVRSMGAFTPVEGDIIKSYDSFATFSGGKWMGTLESMSPGLGYMYYSNQDAELKYPAVRVFEVMDEPVYAKASASENAPWHMDKNKYPYNMTMIASVYASDILAPAGYFTIGAFVGNECRGIGQYVGDKLFMTIYGDVDTSEKVSFKALDNATMEEREVVETTQFGNTMLGSVSSPYRLSVKGSVTGIGDTELNNKYLVYPNPVRSTLYVNGDASRIKSVSVIASSGVTVVSADNYHEDGLNVSNLAPGAYIAVINTLDGTVVQKIIKQ